ncbi:MAG: hypothetical protein GX174_11505 [Lentisphaerae bacterium]|jgi:hypothetical protein|nr:hypothetical protein [Lentisphaerota bacterium]
MDRFNREKALVAAKSARIENEWRAKQEEAARNQPSERDRLTAGIRATEITARDAEKRAADELSIALESAARLLARRLQRMRDLLVEYDEAAQARASAPVEAAQRDFNKAAARLASKIAPLLPGAPDGLCRELAAKWGGLCREQDAFQAATHARADADRRRVQIARALWTLIGDVAASRTPPMPVNDFLKLGGLRTK